MIPFQILIIENDDERDFMIQLYEKHKALLFYVGHKIINRNDILDDLVHDVFVKLISKVKKLQSMNYDIMPAYLSACMKYACINFLKRQSISKKHQDYDTFDNNLYTESFENETIMKMDVAHLRKVLLKLPQRHQDILEYKYILELTDGEIAEIFEINKASVRQYLTRARRAAYDLIKESDFSE